MSGLTADAKTLIDRARVETQVCVVQFCVLGWLVITTMILPVEMQQHRFSYDEPMPVESCTQALSDVALSFGEDDEQEESRMVRHACVSSASQPQSSVVQGKDDLVCKVQSRPFGVALLLAGWDSDGPVL